MPRTALSSRRSAIAARLLPLGFAAAGLVHAAGTVGTGTPASCTEAALDTALSGGGSVTFNCGGSATIVLTGTKNVIADTSIDGGGQITLDGNNAVRHFYVTAPTAFNLTGLTLTQGNATGQGGAMLVVTPVTMALNNVALNLNTATSDGGAITAQAGVKMTLTDVIMNGNKSGNEGGAIYAYTSTTLSLTRVSATSNQAKYGGGAITSLGTSFSISTSAFDGNSTTGFGAAGGAALVNPQPAGTFNVVNSTFYGNGASNAGTGGAIAASSTTTGTINNSTFYGNNGQGTIEAAQTSALTLRNTIISNTPANRNCNVGVNAALIDGGNNIQFGGNVSKSCGAAIAEVDPKLGSFAYHGGFTNTMDLLAGSPAIDAGNDATCAAIDQRGILRPIGAHCDIGAFEAAAAAGTPPTITNGPPPGGTVGIPYSFTYTAAGSTPMTFLLSGTLPPGLLLLPAGTISGTPTTPGTFTGSVMAKNGTLPDATQNFSITIAAAPVSASTASAPTLDAWALFALMAAIAALACFAMPKE